MSLFCGCDVHEKDTCCACHERLCKYDAVEGKLDRLKANVKKLPAELAEIKKQDHKQAKAE